jgi:hypothetical protein
MFLIADPIILACRSYLYRRYRVINLISDGCASRQLSQRREFERKVAFFYESFYSGSFGSDIQSMFPLQGFVTPRTDDHFITGKF